MNRVEFLNILESELKKKGVKEIDSILRDYEELFIEGMKKGLSEEFVVENVDSPQEIAASYHSKPVNVKQDKKEINTKIKIAEFVRFAMVGLFIWFVIDLCLYGSKMPGWLLLSYLLICGSAIILFVVNTNTINKLKSKENELNNVVKKDLEGEND